MMTRQGRVKDDDSLRRGDVRIQVTISNKIGGQNREDGIERSWSCAEL